MLHLNVFPDSEGPGFLGTDLGLKRDGLGKLAGLVAFPGEHIVCVDQSSVPFGFGLDMGDVREWVLYDRKSKRWAGVHWERGIFDSSANFTTHSFSDACTFFLVDFGRFGRLFDLLEAVPGEPKHVYADAMGMNKKTGQSEIDIQRAFKLVENRFNENRITARASAEGELVGAKAKLVYSDGIYCLASQNTRNACWFASLGLALKVFVLVALDQGVFEPDELSIFHQT